MSAQKLSAIRIVEGKDDDEVRNGHFSEIWCSRPNIVRLEGVELAGPGAVNLVLEPSFDAEKDWILVGADGFVWYIIVGTLPSCFKRPADLHDWLHKQRAMSFATPAQLV